MTKIDSALLESLEKDYFDDPRVLALVDRFRSAQSQTPVVVNVSANLSAAIEEWKQHKGELFISLAQEKPKEDV